MAVRTGELTYNGNTSLFRLLLGLLTVIISASVILRFPTAQAALILTGIGLFIVAVFQPKVGVALAVVAIVLSPEFPVAGVEIRLEDIILTAVIAGWALRRLALREGRPAALLAAPLMAYVAIGIMATAWGAIIGTASLTSLEQGSAAAFHLLKRVEFALLFVVVANTLTTITDVKRFTYLLMAALIVFNIYGLQHFTQTGWIAEAPRGAAGHEVGLGSMLLVALALGVLSGQTSRAAKTFAVASMGFALVVLPLSQGRNFTLTTAVLLLAFAVRRRQAVLLLLPAVVWAAFRAYPSHILNRLATLRWLFAEDVTGAYTHGASLLSRIQPPLSYGTTVLLKSPIVGFGLASIPLGYIDSEYVTQLYFTGILGLAVFAWFVASLIRLAKRAAQMQYADPFGASVAAAYAYALAGYGIYSIFSPSISAGRAGALFFLLTGLLAALVHQARNATRSA